MSDCERKPVVVPEGTGSGHFRGGSRTMHVTMLRWFARRRTRGDPAVT
jgi:hypothetical protein